MSEPTTPLVCRLGLHRMASDRVGTKRCIRAGCHATKFDPESAEAAIVSVDTETPVGDYWVTVTRHDGKILYSGPVPVPEGMDALTVADVKARRFNTYEFTHVELDTSADAED